MLRRFARENKEACKISIVKKKPMQIVDSISILRVIESFFHYTDDNPVEEKRNPPFQALYSGKSRLKNSMYKKLCFRYEIYIFYTESTLYNDLKYNITRNGNTSAALTILCERNLQRTVIISLCAYLEEDPEGYLSRGWLTADLRPRRSSEHSWN